MTYSSTLSMSRGQYAGRNQNVVSFRTKERTLGPISNTIILVVLACLLGLLYLTQVTKTNAYGYSINDLQQKQTQLHYNRIFHKRHSTIGSCMLNRKALLY